MSAQAPLEPGLAGQAGEPRRGSDMVSIAGGTFRMGSDQHYPEEAPAHRVTVSPFWIDRTPVTNRQFREFIEATGYITVAERTPDPKDYPGALPHMLKPGSLVFSPPRHQVDLKDWSQWWKFEFGANWRRPRGRGHSNRGLDDHPAVHIAFDDAAAYAAWAGKELPTEAEWEFAARGGLDGAEFAWGDEAMPDGRHMANTWQGRFPSENLATDGYARTSPVGVFPSNGYGLYDMIGNVWEWTTDWFSTRHTEDAPSPCCIPVDPRGGRVTDSYDGCDSSIRIPRKVVKGGSHLCAPNYCRRYRPAARHAQPIDSGMSHVGFRCMVRQGGPILMVEIESQELRLLARLVIACVAMLVIAGVVWHGVSIGVFQRIWHDLMERPGGPMSFRFILQPLMAAITAIVDGLRDARTVRSPFFRAMLFEPQHRMARLVEACNAIARIILLGLVMDIIYQVIVFERFYPAEAVIVALLLAVVPYVVLRGLITRGARRWWHGAPAART